MKGTIGKTTQKKQAKGKVVTTTTQRGKCLLFEKVTYKRGASGPSGKTSVVNSPSRSSKVFERTATFETSRWTDHVVET